MPSSRSRSLCDDCGYALANRGHDTRALQRENRGGDADHDERKPLIVLTTAPARSRKPHNILTSEPFIRLDRKVWGGRLVGDYLRKAGIRPRELFEIDQADAIAVMVDRGLGVSLQPD